MANEPAARAPGNLLAQRDLADTYEDFGKYFEKHDWAKARDWYQKSLDIWTQWPRIAYSGRMDQNRRIEAQKSVARCSLMIRTRLAAHD